MSNEIGDKPRAASCGCRPWDSYDLHDNNCKYKELESELSTLRVERNARTDLERERILHREHWQFKMQLLEAIGFPYEVDDSNALGRIIQHIEALRAENERLTKQVQAFTPQAQIMAPTAGSASVSETE